MDVRERKSRQGVVIHPKWADKKKTRKQEKLAGKVWHCLSQITGNAWHIVVLSAFLPPDINL